MMQFGMLNVFGCTTSRDLRRHFLHIQRSVDFCYISVVHTNVTLARRSGTTRAASPWQNGAHIGRCIHGRFCTMPSLPDD
jgi:hypothetical protein